MAENEKKVEQEMLQKRFGIVDDAKRVKELAGRLQKELDDVIRLADQIIAEPDKSIHFPGDIWTNSTWKYLPETILKCDGKIKAHNDMKRIQRLMSE